VCAWVKTPTSWPTTYRDPIIYGRYTSSSSSPTAVNLFLNDPHLSSQRKFGFIFKTGSNSWGNDYVLSSSVQLNTWYFVVGVRSGSLVQIYVDAVLEGTDSSSSLPINYGDSPIASIGGKGYALAAWYDGVIDDVKIYKKALTGTEVLTMLNSTVSVENKSRSLKSLTVYPNPTSDYLVVRNSQELSFSKIKISNVNGQVVREYVNQRSNSKLNITSLENGLYFIEAFNNEGSIMNAKFVKIGN
jgi:hypothetical protein